MIPMLDVVVFEFLIAIHYFLLIEGEYFAGEVKRHMNWLSLAEPEDMDLLNVCIYSAVEFGDLVP